MQEFSHTIDWALRWVFLIGTPAAIGLIILAEPLLLTLFQYGEFTPNDAHQASLSLMAYGLGLLPFIFIKVLAPGFYARQDTKTPVKIGIIAMISNMGLNIVLMIYLAHVGLALATALSAMLNAGLLYYTLRKKAVYQPIAGWGLFFVRMLLANIVLVAFLLWVTPINGDWISWSGWHRFGILMGLITTSAIVYFAVLTLCGVRLKTLVTPQSQE